MSATEHHKFHPKLEPLIKTTNISNNDVDNVSFAPASQRNHMNATATQINARAVNTSFSNPFSSRSPKRPTATLTNWANLQSEIQIMRPEPKNQKQQIEIEKQSVFQN